MKVKKTFWFITKFFIVLAIISIFAMLFGFSLFITAVTENLEKIEMDSVEYAEHDKFVCDDEDSCEFTDLRPAEDDFVSNWDSLTVTDVFHSMRGRKPHGAVDLAGSSNPYTVYASHDGKISIRMYNSGTCIVGGQTISYNAYPMVYVTNEEYKTGYLHMTNLKVEDGDIVKKGAKLGTMGTVGCSTGIHLHYEVFEKTDGIYRKVDPQDGYLNL